MHLNEKNKFDLIAYKTSNVSENLKRENLAVRYI